MAPRAVVDVAPHRGVDSALPATAPGADPTLLAVVLSLGATFALAAASYRWIEMPVRRDGFRVSWSRLRAHTAVGGITVAMVGLALVALATAPDKSDAQLAVERGERLIEEQNRQAGILPPDEQATTEPAAARTTTVPLADRPGRRSRRCHRGT